MTWRLRVTSVERYHLCDDTVENPNVIGCELTVSGTVDLDIATAALRDTAKRHPMVYARLNGKYWDLDDRDRQQLTWQVVDSNSDNTSLDMRRIIPETEIPTRCILKRNGSLSTLSFRTHHAAMDGGGGLQLVSDWLVTYHRISSGSKRPRSRQTDHDSLKHRNHLGLLSRQFIGKLWIQPIAFLGACKFLFRTVQPIVDDDRGKKTSDPVEVLVADMPVDFEYETAVIPEKQLADLKKQASQENSTVNEQVLRAIFFGIHDFRKSRKSHRRNEWLRLIIPVSIRDFADRRLPAANRATIVQLDRTDKDFSDPAGMVSGLNYELGCIKRWNLEKTFLLLMRCFSAVPGFVSRNVKKNVCRATSVVTNLGSPFERMKLDRIDGKLLFGNLVLEDVDLIVPLRRQTSVGFAILRYAGKQKICLHYDPLQIERDDVRQILRHVMKNLNPAESELC